MNISTILHSVLYVIQSALLILIVLNQLAQVQVNYFVIYILCYSTITLNADRNVLNAVLC